jgi:hypothetical protein
LVWPDFQNTAAIEKRATSAMNECGRLREGNHVLHLPESSGRMGDEHVGRVEQLGDVDEVPVDVVAGLRQQRLARRIADPRQHQRVTIRRCMGNRFGGDTAAGTGPVVDDDRLSQDLRHILCKHAR